MEQNARKRLYSLPEYRLITNRKRRKYLESTLVDKLPPTRVAKLLGINAGREANSPEVKAVSAAFFKAQDPDGTAAIYEMAGRLEHIWYGTPHTPDENFAAENISRDGGKTFITPDCKVVGADGLPVAAPPAPVYAWEKKA